MPFSSGVGSGEGVGHRPHVAPPGSSAASDEALSHCVSPAPSTTSSSQPPTRYRFARKDTR
jgi:hypothetical protein